MPFYSCSLKKQDKKTARVEALSVKKNKVFSTMK